MLRQEMNIAYFDKIHRPGEKLGVLDNASDFEECATRVHCNATHGGFAPGNVWDEKQQKYVLNIDEKKTEEYLQKFNATIGGKRHSIMGGGGHNNVFFPGFYEYKDKIPEALMQTIDGEWLQLRDKDVLGGKPIPMPAIDDPTLLKLSAESLAYQASRLVNSHYVIGYQMGGEMLWPEYFGLGNGDYRPVSWKHFSSWCKLQGEEVPAKEDTLVEGSKARNLWLHYREQAMADRAGYFCRAVLNADNTHLVYYPTHGSTMLKNDRARLGQMPDTLAAVTDGIEMGHILVDNDEERRNVVQTTFNTSYGVPVVVPRLGNTTADLGMAGGSRSFTANTLRRLVMEDMGMGISAIYPIHWRSRLHDGEWFIKDTPAEAECRKVFDEIIVSAPYMMGMGRMQPQMGILASDETWLQNYDPRWTTLMQDALADRVNTCITTDAVVEPGLARKMPLLLAVNDKIVHEKTIDRLVNYMNEGGKVVVWGEFAEGCANRDKVLTHKNCLVSQAPACKKMRVLRESFLTGYDMGCWSNRFKVYPVDYKALKAEIQAFAPEVILNPFVVDGEAGDVNLYALTDRAAVGCVAINNGAEDATFSLKPDERLLKGCKAIDMLTGKEVKMPVTIPGYGTMMIFFGEPVGEDFDEVLCDAEDAFFTWRDMGLDIGAQRHNFANLKTGDHYIKRYALAKALLNSLVMKTQVEKEGDDLVVKVDCYNAKGEKEENAIIQLRMMPGSMKQYVFTWDGEQYVCRVKKEDIAQVYNPDTCDYEPLTGAARFILQAEKDGKQGGSMVNIKI